MGTAVVAAKSAPIRLFHLTFYKCGSQWVRDILADPRIVDHTNHTLAAGGIDLQSQRWPVLADSQFASPLYSTGTGEWRQISTELDRAFVVIRDPRDIVVSLVYSVSLSHTPSTITQLLRKPIADATPENRLQIGMFLLAQWADYLRTWKDAASYSNVHMTRYEDLIADLPGELRRLFTFLQWAVPDEIVDTVAAENGFENRSGRKPGDENEFSHRRKGIAGDWRNHFHRNLGQLFEEAFPDLLTELGYEESTVWWRDLPNNINREEASPETQRSRLLAVLAEHERELAVVRAAAEERLRDIGVLHEALHLAMAHETEQQEELAVVRAAAEERLRDVSMLHEALHLAMAHETEQQEELAVVRAAAEERLRDVSILQAALHQANKAAALAQRSAEERLAALNSHELSRVELARSFSWKFGFLPLRAIGSLFAKRFRVGAKIE